MSEEENIERPQPTDDRPPEQNVPEQTSVHETETQPQTSNIKPQTENMEVHHHAHHNHGKKTWKNYFWEFLMLFLAVFCGFLAEYYLEHRIERERGKQFVESFYEDLKADTAIISFCTTFDEEKIRTLSNLHNCYNIVSADMKNTSCLLDVIKASAVNRPFVRTDRTLKQLANAGGFRLLKEEDADSIISYDQLFNNFQDFQSTVFQGAQDNVRATFNLLVDFKANAQMFRPQDGKLITGFSPSEVTTPVLFSADKALLNKYFNDVQLYYRITFNHQRMLLDLKAKQVQLLEYFKNKYHFK
jgi:hypothetical protein